MNRREFLGVTTAATAIAVVPRTFVRSLDDRQIAPTQGVTSNATIRLFDYDDLMLTVATLLEKVQDGHGNIVWGKGQDIVITSKIAFSFNRVTIELEGLPKQIDMALISGRHTVTPGNTLTLQANPKGFVRGLFN